MTFVPNFEPSRNAPLFHNGPWPAGTSLSVSIAGLPSVNLDATHFGLCGGMSFVTRDIFESHTPQLRNTDSTKVPPELVSHLMARLIQSFLGPGTIGKWLSKTQSLDHDTWFRGEGLYGQTVDECAGIMREIDAGRLCPIGVVLVQSLAPWDVFQNHVELVYGYDLVGSHLRLHVYDCNFNQLSDIDTTTIELDISSRSPARPITTNGTHIPGKPGFVRGFFQVPYTHADPSPAYVDDASVRVTAGPPPLLTPGQSVEVTVTATNTGTTIWTPGVGYRLGSQAPQDSTTWGLGRVEVAAATEPGDDAAFRFTVKAPSAAGVYDFCWQMVREHVHWFGHATPAVPIGVGSDSTLCEQLHQQHVSLAAQLKDLQQQVAGVDWSDPFTARRESVLLSRKAGIVQAQLAELEKTQVANGCAPM